MEKGAIVCALLCALLHVLSASVLKDRQRILVEKKFAHLQDEIDEWKRLGLPTKAAFPHQDGAQEGLLIDLPTAPSFLHPDYDTDVHFYVFTRLNRNGTQVAHNTKALKNAGWTSTVPTKVVVHGFINNINSPLFKDLVPALLDEADVNVIGVDWGKLAIAPFYIEARNHVDGVGKEVAKLLDNLAAYGGLDVDDVHIIGHSLGAHVAGNAGRNVQAGQIARITGLDPAMPLYLLLKSDRLSKDDAALVDVIHTCAGLLGLVDAIGDVDFYPNGGSLPQPGCGLDLIGTCSHGRSYEYLTESATEPDAFPASECSSTSDARGGKCNGQTDGHMGISVEYNVNGTRKYYLKTASSSPFDLATHSKSQGSR